FVLDWNLVLWSVAVVMSIFFFSSRRRHTSFSRDWSSDVCSSDLRAPFRGRAGRQRTAPSLHWRHDGSGPALPALIVTFPGGGVPDRKSVVQGKSVGDVDRRTGGI